MYLLPFLDRTSGPTMSMAIREKGTSMIGRGFRGARFFCITDILGNYNIELEPACELQVKRIASRYAQSFYVFQNDLPEGLSEQASVLTLSNSKVAQSAVVAPPGASLPSHEITNHPAKNKASL